MAVWQKPFNLTLRRRPQHKQLVSLHPVFICDGLAPLGTHGAGAALYGGRADHQGIDAVYVSTDAQTALAEYQQLSPLMPPGTLVSFEINVGHVVDFTGGYSPDGWDLSWNDFHCELRNLWFDKKIEPPSWILGDVAIAAAAKGILFRSNIRAGGVNLVLYPGAFTADDILTVYDPNFHETQATPRMMKNATHTPVGRTLVRHGRLKSTLPRRISVDMAVFSR